ncbi:MAG: DUF5320 domain-containing protein [Candidatus Aminicenantes bacterium]|nr:DUF5320 domain-containing protein [Candidatus Aminicenantes bacterium]
MFWRGRMFGCFRFGFFPFGFYFHWPPPYPSKEEYLRILKRYKEDLEAELREVEKEIEELSKKE